MTLIYRDPLYGGSLKPTPEPKLTFLNFFLYPRFRGVHHDAPQSNQASSLQTCLPTSVPADRQSQVPFPTPSSPRSVPLELFRPKQNKHTKVIASGAPEALLRDPSNTRSASWDASCSSPPVGEGSTLPK